MRALAEEHRMPYLRYLLSMDRMSKPTRVLTERFQKSVDLSSCHYHFSGRQARIEGAGRLHENQLLSCFQYDFNTRKGTVYDHLGSPTGSVLGDLALVPR